MRPMREYNYSLFSVMIGFGDIPGHKSQTVVNSGSKLQNLNFGQVVGMEYCEEK
jgi:hypothetical protein